MTAPISNTPSLVKPRAGSRTALLLGAALILACAAPPRLQAQPPGWSNQPAREATLGRDQPTTTTGGTELYAGSMTMAPGTRTPRWNLPVTVANADVVIEGTLDGPDAQLSLRAHAGTSSRAQTLDLRAAGPFIARGRFVGAFDGIDVTHVGGATMTVSRIVVVPAGSEPVLERVAPQPDPRASAPADDPYATARIAPVPDPYYPEPAAPLSYGPPERVDLFRGDMRISSGSTSRRFATDPGRRILSVETVWTGWFFRGSVYLLVDGERSSRWSGRAVRMRETETWSVNAPVGDIAFAVRDSAVNLQRLTVVYEGRPVYAEPPRVPVDVYVPDPRPPLPPTPYVPAPPMPPFLPHPSDLVPDPPRTNVVSFGPTRIRENRSVTLRLPERRQVESVEIRWSDGRDRAVGYVSVDDENWNARRGQDVRSPGVAEFRIDRRAQRVVIHARRDDISVSWVRVHVR